MIVSHIKYKLQTGGLQDQEQWPEVHEGMVDTMVRFEQAKEPEIQRLP